MTVVDFLLLLVVAGVCGALGQAISGTSRGGCLAAIALGFIGALLGLWLANLMGLPEVLSVEIGGSHFPIVWSILGAAIFVAVLSFRTRPPPEELRPQCSFTGPSFVAQAGPFFVAQASRLCGPTGETPVPRAKATSVAKTAPVKRHWWCLPDSGTLAAGVSPAGRNTNRANGGRRSVEFSFLPAAGMPAATVLLTSSGTEAQSIDLGC